jgi:hypothetical protein
MSTDVSFLPVGKQVSLPGHFDVSVTLEAARPLGKGFEIRVRLPDGSLDEAVITAEEAAALAGAAAPVESKATTVDAEQLRLLVESARIRLAYARHSHRVPVPCAEIPWSRPRLPRPGMPRRTKSHAQDFRQH